MISMSLKEFKAGFFDRQTVQRAVDKAARKNLSKFGAFVRRSAQTSIRSRKRISEPGQPPSSHTGLLKRHIYFAYDGQKKSVVIGPVAWKKRGSFTVPEVLEYGGQIRETKYRYNYRPRPFMRPAFEKEKARIKDIWKDSIK